MESNLTKLENNQVYLEVVASPRMSRLPWPQPAGR